MENEVKKRAIIIAGSIDAIDENIKSYIDENCYVICADNGLSFAQKNGISVDLALGDFDSYNGTLNDDINIIKLPARKDDTDLHFAAEKVIEMGFKNAILAGVTGGRIDHTLAAFQTLYYLNNNGVNAHISDYNTKVFIADKILNLNAPDYPCYFSVFPFGNSTPFVSIKGSEYDVENKPLNFDFPIGVSNEFKSKSVEIKCKNGKILVMICRKTN